MVRSRRALIVIVDDDDGNVELVRRSLRRASIDNDIISFDNGADALEFLFGRGPQAQRLADGDPLVLLDINMPGIDGLEVLRRIKADPITQPIPVIMLTTTDDPRAINRCYELGCNVYITKPVGPDAFIDAIVKLGLFISVVSVPTETRRP